MPIPVTTAHTPATNKTASEIIVTQSSQSFMGLTFHSAASAAARALLCRSVSWRLPWDFESVTGCRHENGT